MNKSILDYFPPGYTPKETQKEILPKVQEAWDKSDVIVIEADTGAGKSHMLQTIARWRAELGESTATLTPRVALQKQYSDTFPEVTVLKGKSRYSCKDKTFKNCLEAKEVCGEFCGGCSYKADRDIAKESGNSVFSIHSYLMLGSRKDNVLTDEAQSLYDIMADQNSIKLWKHKVKYPAGMKDYGDVIVWLEKAIDIYNSEIDDLKEQIQEMKDSDATYVQMIPWVTGLKEMEQTTKKYGRVLHGIRHRPTDYFIEHIIEEFRGKPSHALLIRPTTLEDSMGWLWPTKTRKIVLASATLSQKDIEKLGLSKKRVTWIKAPVAISAQDRPIVVEPAGNMSYKYQNGSIERISDKIQELQTRHDGKGLVHVTYGIAEKLKKHLGKDSSILFHTSGNKEEVLKDFISRPAADKPVLIACGMHEGLDLAGPDFSWQALAKVPWPSKADKLIDHWYQSDFDWIAWITIRAIIQACGRINRYPGDYAVTYIIDSCFGNPKKNRRGFLTQFGRKLPKEFLERFK